MTTGLPATDAARTDHGPAPGGFARRKLFAILAGGVPGQCCYAVAKLGVPDLLAAGPRPVAELAAETGADPRALGRLLRGLVALGLFRPVPPDGYELTSVGELLRADVPGSLRQTAIMHGEVVYRAFAEIMHTVRTGRPAFEQAYGRPFYDYLADHPDVAETFAAAMGSEAAPAVLGEVDLSGVGTLVDVGGGDGGLLAEVLRRHPGLRGVLVELPDSVRAAGRRLAAAGLADRARLVAGDFFESVPGGGDVYVLARVLHNWTDERAALLLRRTAAAMRPGARLLVMEKLLPDTIDTQGKASVDLLMLGLLEGRDRTEAEYVTLLDKAGLDVLRVRPASGAAEGLIEAVVR
ncbi:MAG TPA: methyltransferase [Pseudonocardiaceae bacterium]